jgi:DNA-binding transcriptional MerR regulator
MKEPRRVRSTCATASDHPMATTYRISDLAREFDLTPRAMRFYEDMGLLQPERAGPGGRQRVYQPRPHAPEADPARQAPGPVADRGASELIDMYDSPRDTGPQLRKFLQVLGQHRAQLEAQLAELQATLAEVSEHEKEARALLARQQPRPASKTKV